MGGFEDDWAAAVEAAAAAFDGAEYSWFAGTPLGALAAGLEQDFGREAALELLASIVWSQSGGGGGGADGEEEGPDLCSGEGGEGDAEADGGGGGGEDGGGGGGRRLAAFFIQSRLLPLYRDAPISLLQMGHLLLSFKHEFNAKDELMERLCRILHEVVLPKGNIMTPSLYTLMKMCEVPIPADVEQHVCIRDCMRFAPLKPSEYAAHSDECCSKCGERRFHAKCVYDSQPHGNGTDDM
ncbi:MAG: hypothetical protein J3K34DRAFT_43363 [Monoraphidium minutum]|nr:MAG: hypothetical protein J3K34DRAFT_43363 [Monoraphidium minutum]